MAIAILSTVAYSMVSLAALVLTITMVVVQLAMGQFSPRIVQTFLHESFFHRGVSGQWREVLDDDGLERYWARLRELVEPDLAAWTHQGWLADAAS